MADKSQGKGERERTKALCLKVAAEFKGTPLGEGMTVTNEWKEKGVDRVTVKLRLDSENGIEIQCGPGFPQEGPAVFLTEPAESDVVDFASRKVFYESFYHWTPLSTLPELALVVQSYFKNVPLKTNQALRQAFRLQKEVTERCSEIFTDNFSTKIESKISGQKGRPKKALELSELVDLSPEVASLDSRMAELIRIASSFQSQVESDSHYVAALKEAAIPQIIEFKIANMSLQDTLKAYRSEIKVRSAAPPPDQPPRVIPGGNPSIPAEYCRTEPLNPRKQAPKRL